MLHSIVMDTHTQTYTHLAIASCDVKPPASYNAFGRLHGLANFISTDVIKSSLS